MELSIGERVGEPGRNLYVFGECISTNGLTSLHAARKVFYNYRYDEREFYEAAEDEWINVRVRSLSTSCSSDPAIAARGRERLLHEARSVLGRLPGWFPEPLDWLDHGGVPLLVMSVPLGRPLSAWRRTDASASPMILQAMSELLNLLDALHATGQLLGGFDPDDFVVDDSGRICCTATDRVMPEKMAARRRRGAPRPLYRDFFAAPEVLSDHGSIDCRSDFYSWSAVFIDLLTGGNHCDHSSKPMRDFELALEEVGTTFPKLLRNMSPTVDARPIEQIIQGWCNAVFRAFSHDPRNRPRSVAGLRRVAKPAGIAALMRRLSGR